MINKFRAFSKTKLAAFFVFLIAIPFVFWGMGGAFRSGNTNNIAKINNKSVSTEDFIDRINQLGIKPYIIKKNLENKILENILSEIVSERLVDMEINDIEISISEKILADKIKSNENFLDDNNNFSRVKYEKFLLENNLTAPDFETRLIKEELKKKLFNYIGGGIKSPYFLNNKTYINEKKKIEIDYFDLNHAYNNDVSSSEINEYINDNEEVLKEDYIDFSYTKITPKDLVEIEEFNQEFFNKIDEIDNSIVIGTNINEIKKKYNLDLVSINNYKVNIESEEILKEIYSKRNESNIQLIDKNDYFLLFEITKIDKILPNKTDHKFIDKIKDNIFIKKKYDLHQELFKKIQEKKLDNNEFVKISQNQKNIENITINQITDNDKFDADSVKLIYSLTKESFSLITDKENKIYLAKIKNIYYDDLPKNDRITREYLKKSNTNVISDIYSSYNLSLNTKYKVKIFQTTLDRVKNYFR